MAISNAFNSSGGTTKTTNNFQSVEQNFTNVSSVTVNHTFSTKPTVTIIDVNGNIILGEIRYVSSSQVLINFSASISGTIILR